jgi:signal transducing adaptor molecule
MILTSARYSRFGRVQERLPEPTVAELAAEAQQEATVFSQAANVDRLLAMLRTLDPEKDNLADDEEIQELYRSCMTLRPKVVKLIDKYSQKRGMSFSCDE